MRIELHGVGKRFGPVTALHPVQLDIACGCRAALVGPNGSGKSTLVRMLMGMLHGDGAIALDGLDPALHRQQLAPRIAYVPQIAPRLWAPVRDVVGAVARLREIDPARIEAVAAHLELDLRAVAKRPFRALSGGMRQKVLAALALAGEAELLLLDEPTASMDPRSRATFFDLLDRLPHHPTILLCSHRVEEIRRQVDTVVVMAEGRVRWHGPAQRYLDETTVAVVEIAVRGDDAAAWLTTRGFAAGRGGWWSRTVAASERPRLMRDALQHLNGSLVDVLARDRERTDRTDPTEPPR